MHKACVLPTLNPPPALALALALALARYETIHAPALKAPLKRAGVAGRALRAGSEMLLYSLARCVALFS